MNESRIYGLISIGKKAGKVAAGTFSVDKAIKNGTAELVIIANDASENTRESFKNSCEFYDVESICFGTKAELGRFTGNKERVVVAITDYGIKESLLKYVRQDV